MIDCFPRWWYWPACQKRDNQWRNPSSYRDRDLTGGSFQDRFHMRVTSTFPIDTILLSRITLVLRIHFQRVCEFTTSNKSDNVWSNQERRWSLVSIWIMGWYLHDGKSIITLPCNLSTLWTFIKLPYADFALNSNSVVPLLNRWNWGNGHPSGTVKDVKEEDTEIESKNGKPVRISSNIHWSQSTQSKLIPVFSLHSGRFVPWMCTDQEEGRWRESSVCMSTSWSWFPRVKLMVLVFKYLGLSLSRIAEIQFWRKQVNLTRWMFEYVVQS